MATESEHLFEGMAVCSWKVDGGRSLAFPIRNVVERGGNRLVKRKRPYRDGAKLDDTGSDDTEWSMDALFNNSIEESGLDLKTPLYPTVLDELIASFRVHKTGTLTLPTRGDVRVRVASFVRTEVESARDSAILSLTFAEDNEDFINAQSFQPRSVNASMGRVVEAATFSAQSDGVWNGKLSDLRELGANLEAIANFPGNTVSDVDSQVNIVVGTTNSVLNAFLREDTSNKALLADPKMHRTQRRLEETRDIASRARGNARNGRPSLTSFVVAGACTIFDIAAQTSQSAEDLIDVNPGLPYIIPAGTRINIFGA